VMQSSHVVTNALGFVVKLALDSAGNAMKTS
jgi:hypothetical protein